MGEEIKEIKMSPETTVVCRIREGVSTVPCDYYRGGKFVETKEIPRDKLKELF